MACYYSQLNPVITLGKYRRTGAAYFYFPILITFVNIVYCNYAGTVSYSFSSFFFPTNILILFITFHTHRLLFRVKQNEIIQNIPTFMDFVFDHRISSWSPLNIHIHINRWTPLATYTNETGLVRNVPGIREMWTGRNKRTHITSSYRLELRNAGKSSWPPTTGISQCNDYGHTIHVLALFRPPGEGDLPGQPPQPTTQYVVVEWKKWKHQHSVEWCPVPSLSLSLLSVGVGFCRRGQELWCKNKYETK